MVKNGSVEAAVVSAPSVMVARVVASSAGIVCTVIAPLSWGALLFAGSTIVCGLNDGSGKDTACDS